MGLPLLKVAMTMLSMQADSKPVQPPPWSPSQYNIKVYFSLSQNFAHISKCSNILNLFQAIPMNPVHEIELQNHDETLDSERETK